MIGDAILATGGVVAARIGIVRSKETRAKIQEVAEVGERNSGHLALLTDRRQERRIKQAVAEYARDHPGLITSAVATEALRELLDVFISGNLDEDERGAGYRRHFPE